MVAQQIGATFEVGWDAINWILSRNIESGEVEFSTRLCHQRSTHSTRSCLLSFHFTALRLKQQIGVIVISFVQLRHRHSLFSFISYKLCIRACWTWNKSTAELSALQSNRFLTSLNNTYTNRSYQLSWIAKLNNCQPQLSTIYSIFNFYFFHLSIPRTLSISHNLTAHDYDCGVESAQNATSVRD